MCVDVLVLCGHTPFCMRFYYLLKKKKKGVYGFGYGFVLNWPLPTLNVITYFLLAFSSEGHLFLYMAQLLLLFP